MLGKRRETRDGSKQKPAPSQFGSQSLIGGLVLLDCPGLACSGISRYDGKLFRQLRKRRVKLETCVEIIRGHQGVRRKGCSCFHHLSTGSKPLRNFARWRFEQFALLIQCEFAVNMIKQCGDGANILAGVSIHEDD